MPTKRLKLDEIRFDGGTQMRAGLDGATVQDYREAYTTGVDMPPLVVFFDGSDYWLGDGFHRWHALHENEVGYADCDVRKGSQRDAVWYACGANSDHGLRRTNEDKHKAVRTVLADAEWRALSDRQIADHCGVGNKFVGDIRRQLCSEHSSATTDAKRIGADGKVRKMPERVAPAIPQHTKPTPKEASEPKPTTAKQSAPVDDDSEQADGDCPKGGGHERSQDDDGAFCDKCLEAAPVHAKPTKVKSTVVAQCQALWDALTPTERIFAACWFQDQLG